MIARTKGFDPNSSPSTLLLKGDEEEEDDNDVPLILSPPHDILGSSAPPSFGNFTFTKDHYNLNRLLTHLHHPSRT